MTSNGLSFGVVVLGLAHGCTVPASSAEQYAGTPDVVADSVLVFPSGVRYAPALHGLSYHDQLPTTAGVPFLVLSGFEVESGGEAERAIFVLRPDRSRAAQQTARSVFAFPHAPAEPAAVESRLFVGACTYGGYSGVVQFTTLHEEAEPRHAVIAREIHADSLVDVVDATALPPLHDVLAAVELGRCREVPRRER